MQHTREDALQLLNSFVTSDSLKKHCLCVEAAMRVYAQKSGADSDLWGITGLLHDLDYEKHPDKHPFFAVDLLKEKGYPKDLTTAILGHALYANTPRETQLAKTLFAVDELSGFVMACAHVRPDGFSGMTPKSVRKKLKTARFAEKVNRDEIAQGVDELGIDETEHIQTVIDALSGIAEELGFGAVK